MRASIITRLAEPRMLTFQPLPDYFAERMDRPASE
jgi:hypothetical protein